MNVDGSEQINLTNNPADDGTPSFSPSETATVEITIPETDATSETSVPWNEAKDKVGKTITIHGPVVSTYVGEDTTLLAIGKNFNDADVLVVFIARHNINKFSQAEDYRFLDLYDGKNIYVTGRPYLYEGQIYLEVTDPDQIIIGAD